MMFDDYSLKSRILARPICLSDYVGSIPITSGFSGCGLIGKPPVLGTGNRESSSLSIPTKMRL